MQALRDVDSLREALSGGLVVTLLDAPWMPLYFAACFLVHPLIGWIALGGGLTLLAIAVMNERLTKAPLVESSLAGIRAIDRLSGFLRNAEAVHGLGMAPAARRQWSEMHDASVAAAVTAGERGGTLLACSKFLRLALQAAVMGAGALLVIRQEMSPGLMFATSLLMGRALAPIEMAVAQWKTAATARAAHDRLSRVLSAPAEAPRTLLPEPTGLLRVENLTVVAPGSDAVVVRGASFEIQPGQVVAVVGPTGSGKSSSPAPSSAPGSPRRAASASTAATFATTTPTSSGAASATCPRTSSSWPAASATTSPDSARTQPTGTCSTRPPSPTPIR